MSNHAGPYFANVVEMAGMHGGNAHLVNGYYVPTSARQFSFPIFYKYCERSNCVTSTKLCLFHHKRRYLWVIRDGDDKIIARLKYSNETLTLPEHIPQSLTWELLSTGFFGNFKKKETAHFRVCDDLVLLQQMSAFVGAGSGYLDSVSESIRYVDTTVQDLEALISDRESTVPSHLAHEDGIDLNSVDIEDLTLDEIIELYSNQIFNGYGALLQMDQSRSRGIPFSSLQEKMEENVVSSLSIALGSKKILTELADEAPEEFIDPITMMIMQNPMRMPTSPYVLDRTTISMHLAQNPTDPFSRRPLTMSMIYPDVALQIKIEDWMMSKGVTFA